MAIQWTSKVTRTNGQILNKERTDVMNHTTEYRLAIAATGDEEELKSVEKAVAPIIAKLGGQKTLTDFEDEPGESDTE